MPAKRRGGKLEDEDEWKLHDVYALDASRNRMVTRSQAAYCKLKNTASDLDLFSDAGRHKPSGLPHLVEALKGPYGAVPNTIVTASSGRNLAVSKDMCKRIDCFKQAVPERKQTADSEETKKRRRRISARRRG